MKNVSPEKICRNSTGGGLVNNTGEFHRLGYYRGDTGQLYVSFTATTVANLRNIGTIYKIRRYSVTWRDGLEQNFIFFQNLFKWHFWFFWSKLFFFQARKQVKLCEVIYNLPPIIYLTFFGGCLVSNFLVDTFWWISCLAFYLVDTFLAKISLIDWASSKHLMLTPISDSSWGAVNKKQVENETACKKQQYN